MAIKYGNIFPYFMERLTEKPKPPRLAERGGVWFEQEELKIHLGVESDFRPAKKAYPALLVTGLDELIKRCEQAGAPVVWDEPIEGFRRVYVDDPFGNRIELMEPVEYAPKGFKT
jgi:hypothetical protein